LVFTTLGQTFLAGQPAPTTVGLEGLDGNPAAAATGGVTVNLATSSTGGVFFQTNGASLSGSITIPAEPTGCGGVRFRPGDDRYVYAL
jgi:hypothetical protein